MNFRNMPELKWSFGYPLALGLDGRARWPRSVLMFKRKKWL